MRILSARPLATACIIAMAGAVFSFLLSCNARLWACSVLIVLLLLSIIGFFITRKYHINHSALFLTLFLTCSLTLLTVILSARHFGKVDENASRFASDAEQTYSVTGTILEERSGGTGYARYIMSVSQIDDKTVAIRSVLECTYTALFHIGDVVQLQATAQTPDEFYERETRLYAIADGISLALISEDIKAVQIIDRDVLPVLQFFSRLRGELSARLCNLLGKRNGGLSAALFLGDRNEVNPSITTAFRRTGTAHLLALSGMHVTLIFGFVAFLTVAIPKRARLILLALLSIAYLALIGFGISAIRAVGMLLLFYLADFVGRRHDQLTTLCIVGYTMLTISPATVADGGFWMSFSAVFGLVTVFSKFNEWLDLKHVPHQISRILQALAVSSIAVVSVSLMSWIFCGEISLIGILFTAILSPILTLVLILIMAVLVLDFIPLFSATLIALPLSALLDFMVGLTNMAAQLPGASISLEIPFVGIIFMIMTIVLLLLLVIPLRHKIWLIVPPVVAILAFVICLNRWNYTTYHDELQFSYVSRTSGSALIVGDQEGVAVIDTSAGNFSMLRDVENALEQHSVTEIEHLILTHYHRAYIYSTERLAKRQIIRTVWLPMPQTEEEYFHLTGMQNRLSSLGVEVRCYTEGEPITLFGNAVYTLTNTSYIERSVQPIITYMLQTPSEILAFSSPSVEETPYNSTFRWISEQADIIILSEHGPKIKTELLLPMKIHTPRLMLTDSCELLPYLDVIPQDKICEIFHFTDITHYRFSMKK